MAQEDDKWAAEVDSAETHKKLFEKNVMQGIEEAEEEVKAAQQQWASLFHCFVLFLLFCSLFISFFTCMWMISIRYHVVVQETNEKNRMVVKNMTDLFSSTVNHLFAVEVCDVITLTWYVLQRFQKVF